MKWVTRTEFWDMTPWEFWALVEFHKPKKTFGTKANPISEDEAKQRYEAVYGKKDDD